MVATDSAASSAAASAVASGSAAAAKRSSTEMETSDGYADKVEVHIEVILTPETHLEQETIEAHVLALLARHALTYVEGTAVRLDEQASADLGGCVEAINVCEMEACAGVYDGSPVPFARASHYVHLAQLSDEGPLTSDLDMGDGDGSDGSDVPACQQYTLPSREFHGVWDSLVFDTDIKDQLLKYAQTAMLFADRGVNTNLIGFNRVILLHGPPGTGKTSLCKAVAQKLMVRLSHRYTSGVLIEVNAHSLFSRWFSESGKMVLKLFEGIREMAECDPDMLCAVVIDEVESLSASRSAAASGNEPSDAVRVVNALLTQLDQLKRYANALVLTTSNVTNAIDTAFTDRADLKIYVGNPSTCGRSAALPAARARTPVSEMCPARVAATRSCAARSRSSRGQGSSRCLAGSSSSQHGPASSSTSSSRVSSAAGRAQEWQRSGQRWRSRRERPRMPSSRRVRSPRAVCACLPFLTAALMSGAASLMLFSAAMECDGLSGRALRKLPFLAHALFCSQASMPYGQYVVCLARAAEQEKRSREDVAAKAAT